MLSRRALRALLVLTVQSPLLVGPRAQTLITKNLKAAYCSRPLVEVVIEGFAPFANSMPCQDSYRNSRCFSVASIKLTFCFVCSRACATNSFSSPLYAVPWLLSVAEQKLLPKQRVRRRRPTCVKRWGDTSSRNVPEC